MSKRILFLDDDENRHRSFTRQTIGRLVDHVWTAEQAIAFLAAGGAYDIVFLDGDLDPDAAAGLPPTSPTGESVCRFIAGDLFRERWPRKVVIHSLNAKRAQVMHDILGPLRGAGIHTYRAKFHGGLVNEVDA